MSLSSDSNSSSSYYSIFLGSNDTTKQYTLLSSDVIVYSAWNKLYYSYFMLSIFAYCTIINVFVALYLYYFSFEHNLNNEIKFKALIWSILQIFLTIMCQPIVFKNIIVSFENFKLHVLIFYIMQIFMVIVNIFFITYSNNLFVLFSLWLSINIFSAIGYIFNKYCQNIIEKWYNKSLF